MKFTNSVLNKNAVKYSVFLETFQRPLRIRSSFLYRIPVFTNRGNYGTNILQSKCEMRRKISCSPKHCVLLTPVGLAMFQQFPESPLLTLTCQVWIARKGLRLDLDVACAENVVLNSALHVVMSIAVV